MRIGIMGGTMNPIHDGHVHMAKTALQEADLAQVLMVPAGSPPHKTGVPSAEDRYRMVAAAVAGEKNLIPSRVEVEREGATYTVDTMNILRGRYPNAHFYYIIGEDTLLDLRNWRNFKQVLQMCTFLVVSRHTGAPARQTQEEKRWLRELGGKFVNLDMAPMDVSSTEIRQEIASDLPTPHLAYPIQAYARLTGLYGQPALPQCKGWMEELFRRLSAKRFAHSLSVAWTAGELAGLHGVPVDQARCAGLLHDCAKCMPLEDMQAMVKKHSLNVDASIMDSGALLHGPVGACVAKMVFGVEDEQVLQSIRRHTTAEPGMTDLDMVIYLADKIEPTRINYPLLDQVRIAAQHDLKRAMAISLQGSVNYLHRKGERKIFPATLATLEWLKSMGYVPPHQGAFT